MKRFISLRLTLCMFLLGMVCNVAWADIAQKWTASPVAPWGTTDVAQYPEGVGTVLASAGGTVRLAETKVTAPNDGTVTVKFVYSGGSHKLNILGVDLINASGVVVASDYHHGTTGGSHSNNTYTLSNVVAGDYTLRYFVCNAGKDGDQVGQTNGNITVTGLDNYVQKKTYTISIEGGQTIKIGDKTYSNGDTYAEGTVNKGDITVVAPNGQFAAVSIDDVKGTISVYFATIPDQTTSATYTNAVLYPLQQTAVGAAKSATSNNVYTLSNNVLVASFAKMGGALYFAGSKAMDLLPGTEPFTVAFGDGDNVPASAMTLKNVAWEELAANDKAIGGAEHYAGKALVANYEYTYKGAKIAIVWRAVLRDGSHYLRTEMELTGVNDVDMFNIIPMIYNVDTKAAGSTPAVVGNTRGAVLMSNKIFAGLETPTAYNTVGGATGEEDNWNLTTTMADVSLAANSWVQLTEAEAVKRVEEATGATYPNLLAYKQTGVELKEGQKVEVKVQYKSGSHRLNFGGADLLAENGDIAANDYHSGYSGSQSDKNTFTFTAPNDGTYTIRVFVENKSESIDATSTLTTKIYTPKEGVVINTDVVGIQGRWSRNTTLAAGETWKVGAVVGLIAQDGTQANADIHSTQKRRSFLAYSERERAVPWRANPCYISWYELNINRNNAAPGSEPTNMTADQVLDVLAHWKSDMYDRYGVGANMYIIDDGWDTYGEWNFHSGFPREMRDIAAAAKELGGAGVGAWLGPVGGYGQSGTYRRNYWDGKGGMQLSNPAYYAAFKKAATNLVCNQDGTEGYQLGSDNYTFFKFDGISAQFSSVGPDEYPSVDVGNENAEGIIRLERFVREELREDIFFNTTVGTWASPFWYQITDATWRQENDHGETGNNSNSRENWITYRDRLVYQNYVKNSPICPINTLMTHGFILTKFGPPAGNPRDYNSVRNELRCAFLCGSGMVELYNDYDLMNSINGGALWADLAECIAWQKRNADVLPDAHWVGGNPWTGSAAQVYGWAAWNGTKSSLALRNGANDAQTYTFTLRQALNIPANVSGSIILRSAFGDQAALQGLTEGKAYGIDESITVTLSGSSVYGFEGIDASAATTSVSSIALTAENAATEVEVGKTLVLKAAVNADATFPALAWTSSDEEIATVVGGLVVPKKAGTVTITATAKDGSNKVASYTLTIAPKAVDMNAPIVTDLAQLSNEKVYTLQSARAFLFYHPNFNKICSSTGTDVGSVTYNNTDPNQLFRIEKKNDNYYLYSIGAQKYVAKDGTYVATATDALTFSDVSATRANYPWQLALGGNGMNSQAGGQTAEGIVLNNWTTTDDGNCYKIEVGEIGEVVEEPFVLKVFGANNVTITIKGEEYQNGAELDELGELQVSDITAPAVDGKFAVITIDEDGVYVSYFANNTQFYTIKGGHGGYLSLADGYHDNGNLKLANAASIKDKRGLWTFVEEDGAYKIYNYTTGLSKVLGMTGSEASARASMVAIDTEGFTTSFDGNIKFDGTDGRIKLKGSANNYWNKRGDYLALWNNSGAAGDDQGSKFYINAVDYTEYVDEFAPEVKEELNASLIKGVSSFTPENPNTLWYTTSAQATGVSNPWMEYALPLGNGELGCMVFGGVLKEELQFNEKTLWSGPADVVGASNGKRTFMNFGSLFIKNLDETLSEGVTDYVRYLDIEEGIAGVQFTNKNGTKQTRKYFSSAPDQVIAAQYKSEGTDKMHLLFKLEAEGDINSGLVKYANGAASFIGAMEAVNYAARVHVYANEGAVITTSQNGIEVSNATEVTFYLKGATNFNGDVTSVSNYFTADTPDDVNDAVKTAIETAHNKGFATVETAHKADFTAITKRMTLDLGLTTPTVDTKKLIDNYYPNNANANSTANDHLFLEQLYFHFGRYLAISSNRKPIAAPNNLQGIWNDRASDSPWNSDVHTNINIQMNYWPTEITNLSDLHKPFVNFIIRGAQSAGWKDVATRYNEGHGWSVLTETSLYNSMSTWGDNYLVANVWYTSHLWTHYRYTQDKEFLKQAFPVMWSAAEFWFHRLIEDRGFNNLEDEQASVRNYHTPYKYEPDGTYVAPNEFSAEQHDNQTEDGTAHAQQMIYYLFQNLAEAIDILGVENTGLTADDITKLNLYLEKTDKGLHTETYTGAWGATYNGVNTGDKLLREWKYTPFDISNDRGHRHMSHMMALFPMDQITPESPYFEPAVNSLKLRGDVATGWSMGWKVNLWARAQDGDHAHIIIKNALKHSTSYDTNAGAGGIYYNLFDSHAPFQIDGNFGVCSGIAEMLMQSAHGYINILPALPAVWEKTGTITGMKAMGNFTVDFNWKNGKAQKVTIVSHKGAPLKVRCNRGALALDDAQITVNGTEVAAVVENGIATIPCAEGQTVVIDFTKQRAVAVKVYAPGKRATTLEAGKKYMIYNTAFNGNQDRTGFLYDNGSGLGHTGSPKVKPSALKTTLDAYLWEVETTDEVGKFYLKAADGGYVNATGKTDNATAQVLYIQNWNTSTATKAGVKSEGEDGTIVENANIGGDVFTISGTKAGNTGQDCWNGNPDTFAKWESAHPFAFYEVEEVEVLLGDAFPKPGKTYYIYCDNDTRQYFYNDGGTLKVSEKRTEWSNEYLFTCTFDGQYFQFKNLKGKYLAHKALSDNAHNFELSAYLDGVNLKTPGIDSPYFVMKADGGFDQSSIGTYDPASTDFSTVYKFEEYNFPVDGETYYIYSDTYYNSKYVNRYMYADGSSLKLNTSLNVTDAYKWTCKVTADGKVQFQNGAGKYLAHKGIQDAAYNFTLNKSNATHAIAATLYSDAASRYFVVKNDGSAFDQSTGTYNQTTADWCTDFVFMPVNEVKVLTVNGSNQSDAQATWNGETKALPASWVITPQTVITDATLSVTGSENYKFTGLYDGATSLGETTEIESLDGNLTLTAKLTPSFFSASTAENDLVPVRIRNVRNGEYTLRLNASDNYTGKAVNSGKTAYGENEIWYLVGTEESFKIYNRVADTGLHMVLAGTGSGSAASMNTTADNADFCLVTKDNGYAITPKANKEQSLNMHGGAGADIKLYGAGDGGSVWVVEKMDVNHPITLNVEVDKVWESSPRVAELTFTIDGQAGQTRILGSVEGQKLYIPLGATYEVSSMTYRGYTYNGCEDNDGVLTASYTANDERTLFYSPRDGHPYRIPAIATAPNGDIFAICDYRPCGNDIGYGEVDLVCRVSSDNGVTWTEERTIADGLGHINDGIWKMGFGDPAIVADRESNKVLVMSVCGNRTCWDGNYGEGGENENPNRVSRLYITYDEDKQEWVYGEPEEVTYDVYPKFVDKDGNVHAASLFIGAGKICQSRVVKKGEYYRLYCAVWNVTKTQRQHHNYVIYSDDFGKTWNVLGDLGYENSASKWGNEPKVEELPDGTVVLSSRKYSGRYFNLFTFADDTYTTGSWMGEVGSNEVANGLSFGGNSTNGEIYKVKAVHKESGRICDLMFQSIPTGNDRSNVAIYYKEMEYNEDGTNKYTSTTFAQNWTKGIHVSTKGSCYSTMISQADGRIAFFFEEEPSGYCMVYIPYSIEELTGGAYSLYSVNSTIGQYEIGTFYASEAMQIPEGVKAYVAEETPVMDGEDAEGNAVGTITMRELENLIPAKTGVVILGEANNYKFMPSISYGAEVAGNMLKGWEGNNVDDKSKSEVALPTDGTTNYVLTVMNEAAGFYKKDKGFYVYNNKAYLNVPASVQTIRIRFNNNDGTTDIMEVPTEVLNGNGEIYDLSGRRVEKATKGVFIVNGKKVIF